MFYLAAGSFRVFPPKSEATRNHPASLAEWKEKEEKVIRAALSRVLNYLRDEHNPDGSKKPPSPTGGKKKDNGRRKAPQKQPTGGERPTK